jgi:hypothetical protein
MTTETTSDLLIRELAWLDRVLREQPEWIRVEVDSEHGMAHLCFWNDVHEAAMVGSVHHANHLPQGFHEREFRTCFTSRTTRYGIDMHRKTMDVELTADEHSILEVLLITWIVNHMLKEPKIYFSDCNTKFAFLWDPAVSIEVKREAILNLRTPNLATYTKACQDVLLRHGHLVDASSFRKAFAVDVDVVPEIDLLHVDIFVHVNIFDNDTLEPRYWVPRFDPHTGNGTLAEWTLAEWTEAVRSLQLPLPSDLIRPGSINDQSLSITGFTLPNKLDGSWRLCTRLLQVVRVA